jgi:Tol biopolymer transport system component
MIDQQSVERAAERFHLPDGSFERLSLRRDRKQRNRRIRAGALGIIVALAMGAVLVRSIESDGIPADQPPPSPAAPGTLAYASDGDIYVADPDGSNVVKIADGRSDEDCMGFGAGGQYWAEGSMWSPDGRYLAYRYSGCHSTREAGPKGVVISDAQGKVLAKFATGTGWLIEWSPDSSRVAVWDELDKTIGIYGPDGVRQAQIPYPQDPKWEALDSDPYWTPDGTSLVVSQVELPLDGGAPWQAPPSFWEDVYNPRVSSPDGSRVAYVDHRSLIVARSDGSASRELMGNVVGEPVWSPTGDRIAITAGGRGLSQTELRVLDVATGSVSLVTEGRRGSELEVVGFTPQGDRILFSTGSDGSWSLWSIGVDGSDARLIDDVTEGNFYRVPWS